MKYRFADKNDISLLMDIRLEMLKDVNSLPKNFKFSDEFAENCRRYFENGNHATVIAYDGNKITGCASICFMEVMPTFSHPTGKRAHIMNVYTNPDYRRKGIAKHMLEMLISAAEQYGATELSLDATPEGRFLYQSAGFKASDECMTMVLENE